MQLFIKWQEYKCERNTNNMRKQPGFDPTTSGPIYHRFRHQPYLPTKVPFWVS